MFDHPAAAVPLDVVVEQRPAEQAGTDAHQGCAQGVANQGVTIVE